MSDVSIFKFEESFTVRTILKDNEPWFVAKDVCDVLGISNNRDALAALDEDEKSNVGKNDVSNIEVPNRGLSLINESGLYALVIRSNKPNARKFRKWITSEVLPAIRKTGRYAAPSAPAKPLISAAPYFVPEATYYGVPVMSTTALAKRLNVTPAQIHSILQNNRAGLINGIEIYRIKTAGELRAGGCGEIWGRAVSRIDLFTESGARKIRNHWCPNLPAPSPFSAPAPVSPAVRSLDLPRRNPVRSAEYVTVTADEFRNRLDNRRLVIESTLRKLMAAGYDAREEMAELSYFRETVRRAQRCSEQLDADIKTMLNQIGYMLDIGIDTRYRFDDDGRIIGRENSFTRP